jgi:hypothetical protein
LSCQQFVICPGTKGGWIAKLAEREAGPFISRDVALQVAVAEAGQIRSDDHHICFVVEDARGEVTAARCTCHAFEHMLEKR